MLYYGKQNHLSFLAGRALPLGNGDSRGSGETRDAFCSTKKSGNSGWEANGTYIMELLKFAREQITHLLTDWIFGTTKEVHSGDNQRCTYSVFHVLRSGYPEMARDHSN